MKKIFLSLIIIPILAGQVAWGQNEWAPTGATWWYSFNHFGIIGYVKIEYVNDTIINSQLCKILEKKRFVYNYVDEKYDTTYIGKEYTWADSNKVYIYKHNQFYTLYDFSAQPSDWWVIPETFSTGCDSIGKIKVDSIGTIIINGHSLRVFYCSIYNNSHWSLGHKVIEKIGPIPFYLLPELTENCNAVDLFEGGPLRCYQDDNWGIYSTNISPTCDYIVNIDDYSFHKLMFSIAPNPVVNFLTIQTNIKEQFLISLSNVFGQFIIENKKVTAQKETILDFTDLLPGVYILRIICGNKQYNYKIINY